MSSSTSTSTVNAIAMETPSQITTPATYRTLFVERRRAFKESPESKADLEAYERHDDTHNYTVVKGLIPTPLVGKTAPGGKTQWHKSDTFFTDFKLNYPAQVFSESDSSLVIGNTASHDMRQYLAKWDPEDKDKTPSAGMSYIHLLVIPKQRIYNIVCMDDTVMIDEMLEHFQIFWKRPDSLDKITTWLKTAVENRTTAARQSLESKAQTQTAKTNLLSEFDSTMQDVRTSAEKFDHEIRQLLASPSFVSSKPISEIFDFSFHPAPDASIAHLHMHCVLNPPKFRQFSTSAHDWKSIPANIVKDVIRCEELLSHTPARFLLSDRVLTGLKGVIANCLHWISGARDWSGR